MQKARVEMIRDGDRNTRYFHTSAIIREDSIASKNCKTKDGSWVVEPTQVCEIVNTFF